MHNWTVSTANKCYLDEIKSTHTVEQLPTYDIIAPLIMKKYLQDPSLE